MTALATLIAGGGAASPIWYRALIAILIAFLLLFHLYCATYGTPTNIVFLPIHLTDDARDPVPDPPARPAVERAADVPVSSIDLACVVGLPPDRGLFPQFHRRLPAAPRRSAPDRPRCVAIVLMLLVFEAVRRTVGWSLIVIALFFCFHALTANRFPGVFFGPPISFERLLQTLLFGDTGIFGIPIFVMAQYIVLFLLFGRLLQSTGAGAFFTRIGFALLRPSRRRPGQGRRRSRPACSAPCPAAA